MLEVLMITTAILCVIAWMALIMWLMSLGADDRPIWFVAAALVFAIPVAIVAAKATQASDNAQARCLSSGRAWAITGRHQEMQYSPATKTMHLVTVNDYGCVEWTR
jgi:hypothetical protein